MPDFVVFSGHTDHQSRNPPCAGFFVPGDCPIVTRTPLLDRPRTGYAVSLVVTALGAMFWFNGRIAELSKDAENRDRTATRLIDARNRETEDLRARVASLESFARNCKP